MTAATIQQLSELSAIQRRERRKQRILENADQRMSALLTSASGTYKRGIFVLKNCLI